MRLIAFIAAVSLFSGPAFSQNLTAALPKVLAQKILEFGYKAELEERVGVGLYGLVGHLSYCR
jgi:hypothetical protein